ATAANVDTVMVDGRIIKRHGHLIGFDAAEIVARASRSARRIRTAAGGILAPTSNAAGNAIYCAPCEVGTSRHFWRRTRQIPALPGKGADGSVLEVFAQPEAYPYSRRSKPKPC